MDAGALLSYMSDDTAERADRDAAEDGAVVGETERASGETERLADRVTEHDADLGETVREQLRAREERIEELEDEIEELEGKVKRKAADFENYKKRAERRREELRERATEDLIERLTDVRDNLVRALDQDEGVDIRDGVASTLETFDRVFEEENVETVEPEPGEEVDPHRHEVMMRVESDQPEGTVVDVYRPGYVMADHVVQTAQVTVSEGPADADG
jgi:molecular chaperone GrpE